MNREDYRAHFETLELTSEATPAEINKAYLLLKDIYSTDSLAITAMAEEISAEQTADILERIEDSYRALTEMFSAERHAVTELADRLAADIDEFNGAVLKKIRQRLKVSLDDMALETRVRREHLVNIEADNFAELPVAVYTRGFLLNYAKFLSLDAEKVVESYMANFRLYCQDGAR
ncbi:MAG: helix-turn-helix domain-containing protein [Desulfurivibrionaceae bacterium]|nr:helix-turn-helix domain-containing protein [Desulfobulbales bacterium]MDT8335935.1 helix-turn-helix domain-containing protein [Desulfurivibrionaceae bacterium]